MMQVDDILHDIQPDARTGLVVLSLIEGLEDALTVFFADAYAVVADDDGEMIVTRSDQTGESHFVFAVFISIGEQVAHDLGDGLFVEDSGEVWIRIVDGEVLASLFEGGCKALADILDELTDILWRKVYHDLLLFDLAEVEQLVYKFQQPMGIAIDDLK